MNYSAYFLDHAKNPRNVGRLKNATNSALMVNTSCGDSTRIGLIMKGKELKELKHKTDGCFVAKFSASVLSEKLIGKTAEEVLKITPEELTGILGVTFTMSRLRCAMLPLMAVQKALRQFNAVA